MGNRLKIGPHFFRKTFFESFGLFAVLLAAIVYPCFAGCTAQPRPERKDSFSQEGTQRAPKAREDRPAEQSRSAIRKGASRSDSFSMEPGTDRAGSKEPGRQARVEPPRTGREDPFSAERGSSSRGEAKRKTEEQAPSSSQYEETVAQDPHTFHLPVYNQVVPLMERGDYSGACAALKLNESQFGDKDRLLFLLESGLTYLYAGDFETGQAILAEAESLEQDLYTKSLTVQASTFIVNDLAAPYRGEDFESVMINLFRALGYVKSGGIEDALVEARKVDSKLTAINSQYPEDKKNVYKEDAFARWLVGMLYETDPTSANLNDAFIAYRKALDVYETDYGNDYLVGPPDLLKSSYLTVAKWMGTAEFKEATRKYGKVPYLSVDQKKKLSELTFIHFSGKSPVKVERSIISPLPDGHIVKLAFPVYQDRTSRIAGSQIVARPTAGEKILTANTELGDPVGRIAKANLENRKTRIMAKAIARAAAKYAATKIAEQQARNQWGDTWGWVIGALGNVYAVLSEKADLRFWQGLPSEIRVAKLAVPPGLYSLQVNCTDSAGNILENIDLGTVTTKPGEHRFFTFTTVK
ncbi:MAG: hypothetical protein HY788_21110 [Deltaproteobacteria bacterium]|nr:hypothetical protein [Deltaproteobacteria bacterium]